MDLSMPKNLNEFMHSRVALVTGTALMTTAVLCAYHVMVNADGQTLLLTAMTNLLGR